MDELSPIDRDKPFAPTNGIPDLMVSIFNSVMSALLEVHAPLKRIKITSHHAPWITADVRSLMKGRDFAEKKSKKHASYWSVYKRLQNKVAYEFRKRVQEYYHNLVDEAQNNPKAI